MGLSLKIDWIVYEALSHKNIAKVVLALSDNDEYFAQTSLANNPNIIRVSGGKERVDSVLSGLQKLNTVEWVLVHDAARPCITHEDIDKLIKETLTEEEAKLIEFHDLNETYKAEGAEAEFATET